MSHCITPQIRGGVKEILDAVLPRTNRTFALAPFEHLFSRWMSHRESGE